MTNYSVMSNRTVGWMITLGALGLFSCGSSLAGSPEPDQTIRDRLSQIPGLGWIEPVIPITRLSAQSNNDTVFLEGQVSTVIPLLNQGLYQLTDTTGSVWVFTRDPVPVVGTVLRLEVTIHYEPILVQAQDLGEFYAQERRRIVLPPSQ